MSEKMRCDFCGHEGSFGEVCRNTRDMEEMAIDAVHRCYLALDRMGGGEKGMRYVDLNRIAKRHPQDAEFLRGQQG